VICRKYYFQKPTQFSWGHNVVDAPDSDTFGFFGDTGVLSTQLKRYICNKESLSPS
jgi:hypothetical protein